MAGLPMDQKRHFNKLLDKIEQITFQFKKYRDDPNAVVGVIGVKLKPFEKANSPITAYDALLDSIEMVYRNSKNPIISN